MDFKEVNGGDYLISLTDVSNHRYNLDIIKVIRVSRETCLYYKSKRYGDETNSSNHKSFRKATQEEIDWHKADPKVNINIEYMPKKPIITNTYSLW